ncbi:formate dehydrogenase accessory sulfurtransferase FdhD [Enterovirga aerilata]|uniref:Sulfur carrier protein FdhD n=1 Tax=Enterovirga aerilata TaxID=2730920 RepID=A0A849IJ93_9HYPH|nr:formate dehydrogenase accessory sulfurtransferase FdhD [Enterovirga sp. DB1703]NNM74013.1 formate dehydrogenase accessory sulfurtransferase FdhD [Enterovirga sp. DB1703]
MPDETLRTARARTVTIPLSGAPAETGEREIAVETGVEVSFGGVPFAVMMLTPADLEDFGVGFSLTEGIVERAEEVRRVAVTEEERGIGISIEVAPDRMHNLLARRRSMSGRTGCGVCGIEDLEALERARPVERGGAFAPVPIAAVARALAELPERQRLGRATGATHAAGFADRNGAILLVREDVGRHNALDKLVGAVLRNGLDPAGGFVVVTSRCSFEMVEKAASLGARLIVAISAPTSLAIERAGALGVALVAIARRDTVTVFHGAEALSYPEA